MTPDQDLSARLDALKGKVTDEDLVEEGRYFMGDWHTDLTQCGHGDTGEFGCSADGKLLALLWNGYRSGQLVVAK